MGGRYLSDEVVNMCDVLHTLYIIATARFDVTNDLVIHNLTKLQ